MKKEIKYNKILNIRITEDLINGYQKYCEDNGLLLSKRLRFIIQKDIDGKLIIK